MTLREQQATQARSEKRSVSHFRYCLNAFMISARSVKWFLEREGKRGGRKKYEAWIKEWNARLEDTENAIEMRDTAVHRGLVQTKVRSKKVVVPGKPPHTSGALYLQPGGPLPHWSTPVRTVREFHYVELQGKEREVVALCEQYVKLLARMVKDFVDKHPT
jgi:hypothetical protein